MFGRRKEIINIQKRLENLENSKKSTELIADSLHQICGSNNFAKKTYEEEDKRKAACALNMCTVSVSQIIDYNDIIILEQEYDTILNNLNLENMPKDEALLKILKELLDTITFFRIQEGDKKFIDREYQHKIKDAVWSAVPNLGVLIAGGNPISVALTLGSQIGIGYMNYRRTKSYLEFEKEKSEWKLQRSAIEQFNGLRRELFDTAWRLADEYGFDDKYRLTERQITQYNNILMDSDNLRKYERLTAIKENFAAYAPFWYHFGSVANQIAQQEDDDKIKSKYVGLAKKWFDTYMEINQGALLREDQLEAACALEYVDLLDKNQDKDKILKLLDLAERKSGGTNDVLQLVAFAYLKIDEKRIAEPILSRLVNEDYNTVLNAQILSAIYVGEYMQGQVDAEINYKMLSRRVMQEYLFPWPEESQNNIEELSKIFLIKQRFVLLKKYEKVAEEFLRKYMILFNKVLPVPDLGKKYEDSYFLDNQFLRQQRYNDLVAVLNSNSKNNYIFRMQDKYFVAEILDVLNAMYDAVLELNVIKIPYNMGYVLKKRVWGNQISLKEIQKKIFATTFDIETLDQIFAISFKNMVEDFTAELFENIEDSINRYESMSEFVDSEANLREFCVNQNILEPEELFRNEHVGCDLLFKERLLDVSLLKDVDLDKFEKGEKRKKEIKEKFAKTIDKIVLDESKVQIYTAENEVKFDRYFQKKRLQSLRNAVIVVIDNTSKMPWANVDLLFTEDEIIRVVNNQVKDRVKYKNVAVSRDENTLMIGEKYRNESIDIDTLYGLIKELADMTSELQEESSIKGCDDFKCLNDFKNRVNRLF